MGLKQRSDVVQVTRLIASSPDNVLAYYKSHNLLVILIAILLHPFLSHDVLFRTRNLGQHFFDISKKIM
jgi:hypothetical protein